MSGQSNANSTGGSIRDRIKMFEQIAGKEEAKAKVGALVSSAINKAGFQANNARAQDETQKHAVSNVKKVESREEREETVGKSVADRLRMFQNAGKEEAKKMNQTEGTGNLAEKAVKEEGSVPKPAGKVNMQSIIHNFAHAHERKNEEAPQGSMVKSNATQSMPVLKPVEKKVEATEIKPVAKETPQNLPGKIKSPFLENNPPPVPVPKPVEKKPVVTEPVPQEVPKTTPGKLVSPFLNKETQPVPVPKPVEKKPVVPEPVPQEVPKTTPGKLVSPFLNKETQPVPVPKPVEKKPVVPEPVPQEVPKTTPGKLVSPFLQKDSQKASSDDTPKLVSKNSLNLSSTPKSTLERSNSDTSFTTLPSSMPSIKDRIAMLSKPAVSEETQKPQPKPAPKKLNVDPNLRVIGFGAPPPKQEPVPVEEQVSGNNEEFKPVEGETNPIDREENKPTVDLFANKPKVNPILPQKPAQNQSVSKTRLFENEEEELPAQNLPPQKPKYLLEEDEKPVQTLPHSKPKFLYEEDEKPVKAPLLPPKPKSLLEEDEKPVKAPLLPPKPKSLLEVDEKPIKAPLLPPKPKSLFEEDEKPIKAPLLPPKPKSLLEEDEKPIKAPLLPPKPKSLFEDEEKPVSKPPEGYVLPRPVLPPPPKVSLQEPTVKPLKETQEQKQPAGSLLFEDKDEESAITLIKLGGSRGNKPKPEQARQVTNLFADSDEEDTERATKSKVSIEDILSGKSKTASTPKHVNSDLISGEMLKPTMKRNTAAKKTSLFDEE